MPPFHGLNQAMHLLRVGEIVDLGSGLRLDLDGPAGASPCHPLRSLLPNRATTAAGRRLRGRDLCLGFGELVRTGTLLYSPEVLIFVRFGQPASTPAQNLGRILHHEIDLPMLEFTELQRPVGVPLHGKVLHILLGHATSCLAEVVLVDAGKSAELRPQPLPLFPALLGTVRLSTIRFESEVTLTNAHPHSGDMLVSPDVGILDYIDPGPRQRDVFRHAPDGTLSRLLHILLLLGPRTRGRGRAFALVPCPCLNGSLPDRR